MLSPPSLFRTLSLASLYLFLIWEWRRNQKRFSFWLGWGIVLANAPLILHSDVWKMSEKMLLVGGLAGIVSLLLSFWFIPTGPGPKRFSLLPFPLLGWMGITQAINCSKEEFLWRVLPSACGDEMGVLFSTWFFTLSHFPSFHTTRQAIEFFGFSAALGILYLGTGSLLAVTIAHWIRNMGILFWRAQKI